MHWNHRLIKYTLPDREELYAVREVFYKEDGSLCGYVDDPDGVQGGSPREVSKYITWMRKALKMSVLTPADFGLTDEQALKKDWDRQRGDTTADEQEDRMTTDTEEHPPVQHAAVYQRLELLEPDEQLNYAVTCPCGFICNWHHSLTGAVRCAGRHDAEAVSA